MDLLGDHTRLADICLSNKTFQEIRPKSQSNAMNEKSSKNQPKMQKNKKNAQDDKRNTRLIFGLLHEVQLQATPSITQSLEPKLEPHVPWKRLCGFLKALASTRRSCLIRQKQNSTYDHLSFKWCIENLVQKYEFQKCEKHPCHMNHFGQHWRKQKTQNQLEKSYPKHSHNCQHPKNHAEHESLTLLEKKQFQKH